MIDVYKDAKNEIIIHRTISYEEVVPICDELKKHKMVIVNISLLDKNIGRRVVDFLSGSTYALDGSAKKVGENVYVFAPECVELLAKHENNSLD